MKFLNKLMGAGLLLGLCAAGAKASTERSDATVRDMSGEAKYFFDNLAASTSTILVDLSDVTNFPHKSTGYAVVTAIRVNCDKIAASSATVKVGVVTAVSSTNGNVSWFFSKIFDRDMVGTHLSENFNPAPAVIRTYVNSSGVTPFIVTVDKTASSTTFQTDVGLPTTNAVNGSVFPAVGDIILQVVMSGTTALDLTIELFYYTERD